MLMNQPKFSAAFSRGLGLLLIALILYGTTVDAAHRHGRLLPASSDSASITRSDQTANTSGKSGGCSDCLICQLQQNLNTTLIFYRLVTPPQRLQIRVPAPVSRDIFSHAGNATAGRAPPFIS